jgi:hypothetical protein
MRPEFEGRQAQPAKAPRQTAGPLADGVDRRKSSETLDLDKGGPMARLTHVAGSIVETQRYINVPMRLGERYPARERREVWLRA